VKIPLSQFLDDRARRYRWEKLFWMLNVPIATGLFLFQRELWETVSVLYLVLVSIYALVLTAGGAVEAAVAAKEASNDE